MLTEETFKKGIALINMTLHENHVIADQMTIETYYNLLQDLEDECFSKGIIQLCKELKNPYNRPGPGLIREYAEKICNEDAEIKETLFYAKQLINEKRVPDFGLIGQKNEKENPSDNLLLN